MALALELRADGQEAHLGVPPDFCDWLGTLGLPVTLIGPELRKMAATCPAAPSAPPPAEQVRQQLEAWIVSDAARLIRVAAP